MCLYKSVCVCVLCTYIHVCMIANLSNNWQKTSGSMRQEKLKITQNKCLTTFTQDDDVKYYLTKARQLMEISV